MLDVFPLRFLYPSRMSPVGVGGLTIAVVDHPSYSAWVDEKVAMMVIVLPRWWSLTVVAAVDGEDIHDLDLPCCPGDSPHPLRHRPCGVIGSE